MCITLQQNPKNTELGIIKNKVGLELSGKHMCGDTEEVHVRRCLALTDVAFTNILRI
jgi:hypothetical protein